MQQDVSIAAVDNDFIDHLVKTNIPDETLFKHTAASFDGLKLKAVVHPLVYKKEMDHSNKRTKLLFAKKLLQKIEFEQIFSTGDSAKAYYLYLIDELYRHLKGEPLSVKGDKVLSFWQRKKSLGEIHSLAMCCVCKFGMFLSDDDDSKYLKGILKTMFNERIPVHNREEFFNLVEATSATHIPRKDRRKITHKT